MEISQDVQNKLKCSECDEVLSCGPVFLLHETGGAICGRCSQQSEQSDTKENNDRTRIVPYEAVASLLVFPCAFAARGCPEKVSFTLGQPPHESNCKFRPFMCPIAPPGSCDWIGSWPQLKAHCKEKHKSNILENNCNFPRPDLTTSNLQAYLISAFDLLFLFHLKVCVSTGKLFHCVRMFGDSKFLNKFSYSMNIKGNNKKFIESGLVFPPGIVMLQEDSAISILINNLLGILGGKYNETKFKIKIQGSWCLKCFKNIENVSEFKLCEKCVKKLVKCHFNEKGCLFVDVESSKCFKHEEYFCEYQTRCIYCVRYLVASSITEHLQSSDCHEGKTIISDMNSDIRLTQTTSTSNFISFPSNNIGTIICKYGLFNSNLYLWLYTSLPSFKLENITCSIKLSDPQTDYSKVLTPQIENCDESDWEIIENMDKFPSWGNIGLDVNINIYKNV